MSAVIYDFKRSFFRLSTLLLLIIFILVGIASTYLIYSNMVQQGYSLDQKLSVIATVDTEDDCLVIKGYIFDEKGDPLSFAQVELYINDKLIDKASSADGFFMLCTGTKISPTNINELFENITNLAQDSKLVVTYRDIREEVRPSTIMFREVREIPLTNGFPRIYYLKRTLYTYHSPTAFISISSPILIPRIDKDNVAIVYFINPFFSLGNNSIEAEYCIGNYLSLYMEKNITKACEEIKDLGVFNKTIISVKIPLDPRHNGLAILIKKDDLNTTYISDYSTSKGINTIYLSLLSTPLGMIVNFAPIIMLYLAYVLMAKPRSIGALEFILARPITRLDLYLTRYFAAVLTGLTLSIAVILGLGLSTTAIIGITPDITALLTIILGLFLALTAIYSVYYALATSIRSGLYLAISIILYLIFTIFWQTIVIIYAYITGQLFDFQKLTELISYSYYFNPVGAVNLLLTILQKSYGLSSIEINPYYVGLSVAIWIIVPFILGYLRFRRINLST